MPIRRLLLAVIVVTLMFAIGRAQALRPQPSAQEALDAMEIVGYADRLTAQPGDAVKFMVSSRAPRYRVDIVRIVHGDSNPKGPGMKETVINTPVNGEYAGKRQVLPLGSYVTVRDNPALRMSGSFTLAAWIAATRHDPLAPGGRAADGDQGILTKRMPGSFDPRAAFVFEGIGADEVIGDFPSLALGEGAAGQELDRVDYAVGSPPHTLILAQSFGHSDAYQHVVEEVNTSDSKQGGTVNPLVHADLAYLEYPNGGAVFSTGSIAWAGSLSYNNYTNNVSRITENVLRRFASDAPLPPPAARSTSPSAR